MNTTRRDFLRHSTALGAAMAATPLLSGRAIAAPEPESKMQLGLVTYLWGQDWDLPTLIANCEKANILAVETRVEHAHGVMPTLSAVERTEVKKRFADSPVELIGPGTNQDYDDPDPVKVRESIEATKEFIKLSHDCGGSGIKVKPNSLHKGVDPEQTIAQIGRSLNVVGKFAADYGQTIRVEVHGSCAPLPIMKQIIDHVDSPAVGLCWNCNDQDLEGEGIESNFNLVKDRFADTVHVRELNVGDYPYQKLMDMFVAMNYAGWVLLECRTKPDDRIAALNEQREVFFKMIAAAQAKQ